MYKLFEGVHCIVHLAVYSVHPLYIGGVHKYTCLTDCTQKYTIVHNAVHKTVHD